MASMVKSIQEELRDFIEKVLLDMQEDSITRKEAVETIVDRVFSTKREPSRGDK